MHMITNPSPRDHAEVDLGPAAGVSDRGLRHHRNEDAMALAAEQAPDGPAVVAVVCDGVSSSARPDEASQVAAQAALPVLVAAVNAGGDLAAASLASVAAARQSVAAMQGPGGDTSATTFVSAVASGYEVALCWLGDSRAYWLGQPAAESRPLTRDDSVAGGMVAAGLAGEAADLADEPDRAAHVERYTPPGPGALLMCSDGLWNYLPEAADLAGLALPKALSDPLGAAADMVKFAIDAGGADNITVVLIPYLAPEAD